MSKLSPSWARAVRPRYEVEWVVCPFHEVYCGQGVYSRWLWGVKYQLYCLRCHLPSWPEIKISYCRKGWIQPGSFFLNFSLFGGKALCSWDFVHISGLWLFQWSFESRALGIWIQRGEAWARHEWLIYIGLGQRGAQTGPGTSTIWWAYLFLGYPQIGEI